MKLTSNSIITPSYSYTPQPQNPLLFESIKMHSTKTNSYMPIAVRSSFHIHARLWPFVTLNFNTNDITTKIVSTSSEPYAILNQYSFFLKLLGFNLEMKLQSNAVFFENTVVIPMLFSFPVIPKNWLKDDSGLLYSWTNISENLKFDLDKSSLPLFQPNLNATNLENLATKVCQLNECSFSLVGSAFNRPFVLSWVIPVSDLLEGFYPLFVRNLDAFETEKNWGLDNLEEVIGKSKKEESEELRRSEHIKKSEHVKKSEQLNGVYFNVSKLSRKFYQWRFWITIGDAYELNFPTHSPTRLIFSGQRIFFGDFLHHVPY